MYVPIYGAGKYLLDPLINLHMLYECTTYIFFITTCMSNTVRAPWYYSELIIIYVDIFFRKCYILKFSKFSDRQKFLLGSA